MPICSAEQLLPSDSSYSVLQ